MEGRLKAGRLHRKDGYEVQYQAAPWEPDFRDMWRRTPEKLREDGEAWAEAEYADCLRREQLASIDELDHTGMISFCELEAIPSDQDLEAWAELDALGISLRNLLRTLSDREARILKLRFGLDDGYCRTWAEIGNKFGLTRERVRQIEAKALRRLRHPTRSRQLYSYTHRGPVKPKLEPEPEFMPYPEEHRLRDRAAALYWSTVLT